MQPEPLQRSPWNLALEAVLEHPDLTKSALRLYLVLMRTILGFRKEEERLGRDLLRSLGRFDGRTFERARQELVEAGLLHFEPGSRGAGHRSLYRLLNAAPERPLNAAPQRHINAAENAAENAALSDRKTPLHSGDEVFRRMNEEGSPAPAGPNGPALGAPGKKPIADLIEIGIRNGWHEYDDEAIVEEIEKVERSRNEKLTAEARDRLLKLAEALREPEPSLKAEAVA